jgi:hypothetical protein
VTFEGTVEIWMTCSPIVADKIQKLSVRFRNVVTDVLKVETLQEEENEDGPTRDIGLRYSI